MSDPRVFFAAERTLLAWARSGLTVMALGFVVARFGLFLNIVSASLHLAHDGATASHRLSEFIGIALVVLGAGSIAAALHNHRAYIRSLPPEDIPQLPMPWITSLMATLLAVIGILLAAYLALV
ncbi:MAG: YidH family protein [Stenotrophobium sp.]